MPSGRPFQSTMVFGKYEYFLASVRGFVSPRVKHGQILQSCGKSRTVTLRG